MQISLSELPNALRGRRVLQKHKSYAMYHPAAYHLATVAADILLERAAMQFLLTVQYIFL